MTRTIFVTIRISVITIRISINYKLSWKKSLPSSFFMYLPKTCLLLVFLPIPFFHQWTCPGVSKDKLPLLHSVTTPDPKMPRHNSQDSANRPYSNGIQWAWWAENELRQWNQPVVKWWKGYRVRTCSSRVLDHSCLQHWVKLLLKII